MERNFHDQFRKVLSLAQLRKSNYSVRSMMAGAAVFMTVIAYAGSNDKAPTVKVMSPDDGFATNGGSMQVTVEYSSPTNHKGKNTGNVKAVILYGNNEVVGRYDNPPSIKTGEHTFSIDISSLADGPFHLFAEAYMANEKAGHAGKSDVIHTIIDRTSPLISAVINPPPNEYGWNNSSAVVKFEASDQGSGIKEVSSDTVLMDEGEAIPVEGTAVDNAGNSASTVVYVNIDLTAPEITNIAPPSGSETYERQPEIAADFYDNLAGIDIASVSVRLDGIDITSQCNISSSGFSCIPQSDLPSGNHSLQIAVSDSAGNSALPAMSSFLIVTQGPPLPPDPSTVAPPLDPTRATSLAEAVEFLYTGDNPIQTGVNPEDISAERLGVIHGKAMASGRNPLSGVTVTILDHPEFGQTLTREDGAFDLVVNGGGLLTLCYNKPGYLPVQRPLEILWNENTFVDDVIMIQLDPNVTAIDLTNPDAVKVAQGSVVSDDDGERQARVFFPQGVSASLVRPDGSLQPVGTLHVRLTEYSVGPEGPDRMPGPLPATVAYTYCAELTADEALAKINGKDVVFNQQVYFYVDNFLEFPAGGIVPVGYYDNTRGIWAPSENGSIIEILSVDGGIAAIDIDGSGQAAQQQALDSLGFTVAELEMLASAYEAGKSLWRAPLKHFSTYDLNFPYEFPPDATPPEVPAPESPEDVPEQCQDDGSIIDIQSRVLREKIQIAGTNDFLSYSSGRAAGCLRNRNLNIPLCNNDIPSSLAKVSCLIEVAGRKFYEEFDPQPFLSYSFSWDGKDSYGRFVNSRVPVEITIGYWYQNMIYMSPPGAPMSFGLFSDGAEPLYTTRENIAKYKIVELKIGLPTPAAAGGWFLNNHHAYDISNKT
ncbi:MAG: hypothetical protein GF350_17505, partial [Chitinivibrionales bacterium]|nr:hypothetical protein [Chitinivibrionales bacterium]